MVKLSESVVYPLRIQYGVSITSSHKIRYYQRNKKQIVDYVIAGRIIEQLKHGEVEHRLVGVTSNDVVEESEENEDKL